jgi:hypothetical protein
LWPILIFDKNGLQQMVQIDQMFGPGVKILFNEDPVSKWPQLRVSSPGKNQHMTTYINTLSSQTLKRLDPKLDEWKLRREQTCKAMRACKKQMKTDNVDKSELLSNLLSKVMGKAQHAAPPTEESLPPTAIMSSTPHNSNEIINTALSIASLPSSSSSLSSHPPSQRSTSPTEAESRRRAYNVPSSLQEGEMMTVPTASTFSASIGNEYEDNEEYEDNDKKV